MHKELTTLEIRAKFAGMGLESFVRDCGRDIRLVITKKDSKGKPIKQVSATLRKIGCKCVIESDEENL